MADVLTLLVAFFLGAAVAISLTVRALRRVIARAELTIANTVDDIRSLAGEDGAP